MESEKKGNDTITNERQLIAYAVDRDAPAIIPAGPRRDWMDQSSGRFAYRCLRLVMANQSGWFLLNPMTVRLTWDGGTSPRALTVEYDGVVPANQPVVSTFGGGIATWTIPYVFRTPPDYNLLVRGPANLPVYGLYPLEGIVETDWSPATFTMNWQMTVVDEPVLVPQGQPFCMIIPQRKDDIESFVPLQTPITCEPELAKLYREWHADRNEFIRTRSPQDWQGHYMKGVIGVPAPLGSHRTKLRIREFTAIPQCREDG